MKAMTVIFLSLIAVAKSRVPERTEISVENLCQEEGPEVMCASTDRISDCNADEFCRDYLRKTPCERGPEVFCKNEEITRTCGKVAYCVTWRDDSVVAIDLSANRKSSKQVHFMGVPISS